MGKWGDNIFITKWKRFLRREKCMKKQKILLVPMLGLALVATSCSKGGVFGGVLGSLSLGSIDTPSGFSSYNPPVNSKMSESKSNITGANNDIVLTIMSQQGLSTKQDLLSFLASSDPNAVTIKNLLSAHEITIDEGNCSTDDANLIVSDGEISKTLEEAFVSTENLVVCPYSVTSSINAVKSGLNTETGSSSFSAISVSGKSLSYDAQKSLASYLYEQGGNVDCNSSGTFPGVSGGSYDLATYAVECGIYKQSSLVGGSSNGDSYKLYERIYQKYELESSLELTILDEMSKDDNKPDIKAYAEKKLAADPKLKTRMVNYVKSDAKNEFLQVSLNAFMSHGVNIFSLFTYFGIDVSETASSLNGADSEKIKQLYTDNAFKIITTDKAKSNFFFAYKPGFRFFVDMFIDGNVDAYDASGIKIGAVDGDALQNAKVFRYYLNPKNLCNYILTTSSSGNSSLVTAESLAECLDSVTPFIDRLIVMHDMKSKLISFYYSDPGRIAQTKFIDFSYNYNYQSDVRVDSNSIKNVVIAVLERELIDHPTLLEQYNIGQSDIDFLKSIEIRGKVFLADKLKVGEDRDNRNSLADIGLSDLGSKVGIGFGDFLSSSTEGFYLKIPEDLGSASFGTGNNALAISSSSEGDIVVQVPRVRDLLYLEHTRGNNIYKDRFGINIPEMFVQFPPYQLSEQDLLIAYLDLDQQCDSVLMPVGYTCDAQFKLVKPQFKTGNANRLSKLLLKKFDIDTNLGSMASTYKEWGFGITPVSAKFNAPVSGTSTKARKISAGIEVSPMSFWSLLRNDNSLTFGSETLPFAIDPYVDGVSEFQVTIHEPIFTTSLESLDSGSGGIYLKQDGTVSSMTVDYAHLDLIDSNGVHKLISRCSLPIPLANHIMNDSNGNPYAASVQNAFAEVMGGVLSESYTEYPCI